MGYYNKWAVLLIPASIKQQALNYLNRHGISGDVFDSRPIIRLTDDDDASPRGYAAVMRVDNYTLDVLRQGADLHAQAECFVSTKRNVARDEALEFIRGKGLRIRPRYWMALLVRADLKQQALKVLRNKGIKPTNTYAFIKEEDPNDTAPRAYGAMFSADQYNSRDIDRLAAAMPGAFTFTSTNKSTAQSEAMAFVRSKGYKLKT